MIVIPRSHSQRFGLWAGWKRCALLLGIGGRCRRWPTELVGVEPVDYRFGDDVLFGVGDLSFQGLPVLRSFKHRAEIDR